MDTGNKVDVYGNVPCGAVWLLYGAPTAVFTVTSYFLIGDSPGLLSNPREYLVDKVLFIIG
jgi:hypothetical protein